MQNKLAEEIFAKDKRVITAAAKERGIKYEPDAAKFYFDTNTVSNTLIKTLWYKHYKSGFVINPSIPFWVHHLIVKFMIHQTLSLLMVCLKSSVLHLSQFMVSNVWSILKMALYHWTEMVNILFKSWVNWVWQGWTGVTI